MTCQTSATLTEVTIVLPRLKTYSILHDSDISRAFIRIHKKCLIDNRTYPIGLQGILQLSSSHSRTQVMLFTMRPCKRRQFYHPCKRRQFYTIKRYNSIAMINAVLSLAGSHPAIVRKLIGFTYLYFYVITQ